MSLTPGGSETECTNACRKKNERARGKESVKEETQLLLCTIMAKTCNLPNSIYFDALYFSAKAVLRSAALGIDGRMHTLGDEGRAVPDDNLLHPNVLSVAGAVCRE